MSIQRKFIKSLVSVSLLSVTAWVQAATITVTIPPLAGMVAPILHQDDRLNILLDNGVSPHGFQLKPKDIKTLADSDLALLVGTPVDAWAQKVANKAAHQASMVDVPNLFVLQKRNHFAWVIEQAHEHHHKNYNYDGHLWLSYQNTTAFIEAVSKQLMQIHPEQAQYYQARTQHWLAQLSQAYQQVAKSLEPYQNSAFLVLHDGFQYFEQQFSLKGVGALRLNPEMAPSLKHILALRKRMSEQQVQCIFKEPQFPEKNIQMLVKNQSIRVGELDPMGSLWAQSQGYLNYDDYLLTMGKAFSECLGGQR